MDCITASNTLWSTTAVVSCVVREGNQLKNDLLFANRNMPSNTAPNYSLSVILSVSIMVKSSFLFRPSSCPLLSSGLHTTCWLIKVHGQNAPRRAQEVEAEERYQSVDEKYTSNIHFSTRPSAHAYPGVTRCLSALCAFVEGLLVSICRFLVRT
jgi:hypothetical protein